MPEVREPGRFLRCVVTETGELRPTHPGRAADFLARAGEAVVVREMTAADLRTERQSRYWFGAIVATVRALWEKELGALIPKEAVHDKLVTIFGGGLVDTPEGPARTSSALKTKREFSRMVEEVRDYVWHRYGVPIPSGEDWLRDHADEEAA